jgi:flagella basal body P-ring formation protein FlgA
VAALLAAVCPAAANAQIPPAVVARALDLATQAAQVLAPRGARILASAGQLDPRLRLASCERIDPYLAAGVQAWGHTRVGLRCVQGPVPWKVFLPVAVQVWSAAVVARADLPAGTRLEAAQVTLAEVDWATAAAPPFAGTEAVVGRVLARPLAAGQAPRATDLQPRLWFALGETVRVLATGPGFSIDAVAEALTPGFEGQLARVRTESGQVVVGRPVGERRIEVAL